MPIPAGDLALLRGRTHIIKPKLNIFPMQVVATATVATFPVQYPIGSLNINNTSNWANVKPGQLFRITDINGDIVTYGVVRLAPTSGILYIDGKSRGDAGYARRLLRAIDVGQTVSVFSYEPMWTLLSRIFKGVFYKNYDVPYTDQGSKPSPVCNIGSWRQVDADYTTGRGILSFNNTRSFGWFNANIVSYTWTVPSGTVFLVGSASTPAITISLPAGFHVIRCTIVDSRGKSQSSMRPIWVNHPIQYPPVSDLYGMEISADSQDRSGRNVTFRLYGDIPQDLFVPGGAILFTEEDIYENGDHLSDNVGINNYAGFMSQEIPRYDLTGQKSMEIETKGPYKRMADIPMVSQAIIETASPANWTQIANGFGTIDFVTWYILKHHTTFLDMFDFEPLKETTNIPRKKNWGLNGGTVAEYLEQMGKMIRGNIGSSSEGTLYLRRDPTIEENTFRNALDERITWTEHDIVEPIEISTTILPTVGQIRAFAFAYGTQEELNAVAAIAPGFVQGMGPSKQDEESLLVGDPGTAQDKINRIAGHIYAKLNNPQPEIQIKPNRNMDVADPVRMLWHRINVNSALAPQNITLNERLLPKGVDRTWENNNGVWLKRLTTTFETETYGQPGETYIIDKGGGSVYPPIDPGTEQQDTGPINFKEFKFLIALDTLGNMGITSNAKNYRRINANATGRIGDFAVDWGSAYIASGFVDGSLGMWVAALDENEKTIRLYYCKDVLVSNINWQLAYEIDGIYDSGANIGVSPYIRVLTHAEDINHVAVVFWDTKGTHILYTLDFAAHFSDIIDLSQTGETDHTSRDAYVGADIEPDGTVVTSGISFGGQNYQLMYLPNGGGPGDVEIVTGSPNGNAPYPMVKVKKDGNRAFFTKLNRSISINQQAIINTTTHQVGNPQNAEGGTDGQFFSLHDEQWITGSDVYDSPICFNAIPEDLQPNLDFVFFTIPVYGTKPNDTTPIPADTYKLSVSMSMTLDGQWDVSSIDVGYAINALAYEGNSTLLPSGYYITDGSKVTVEIEAYSAIGLQYSTIVDVPYTNDLHIQGYGGITWYCFGGVHGGSQQGLSTGALDLKGITSVNIKVSTEYHSYKGQEASKFGFDLGNGMNWHCELGITSLTVNGSVVTKETPRLYKIVDYQTSSTSTHISPDGIWAPFHPYGLAFDPVIKAQTLSIDSKGSGTGNNIFTSTNGGTTWTPHGFVKYVGVRNVAQSAIYFGRDKLDITSKTISPIANLQGDWATAVSKTTTNTFTNAISANTIV